MYTLTANGDAKGARKSSTAYLNGIVKGTESVMEFQEFGKIARLSRECTITEKIDGTNASIFIGENGEFLIGSRSRWITPEEDNYGFAKWALTNKEELLKLGVGHHFGEWWGIGIQLCARLIT